MNLLISQANQLLMNRQFEYAFCAGFAIELFLNKEIRKHGDIDISVYWVDRDKIILYIQSLGLQATNSIRINDRNSVFKSNI